MPVPTFVRGSGGRVQKLPLPATARSVVHDCDRVAPLDTDDVPAPSGPHPSDGRCTPRPFLPGLAVRHVICICAPQGPFFKIPGEDL